MASSMYITVDLFRSFRFHERHNIPIGQLNQLAHLDGKAAQAVFVIDLMGLSHEVSWEDFVAVNHDPLMGHGRYMCGEVEFRGHAFIEYFTGLGLDL